MYFIWYLLIGLAAGWLANLIVKGGSAGLMGNLIVGLVGGLLGGWILSLLGLVPVGTLGSLATAVIGAVAACVCYGGIIFMRGRKDVDDALDVMGVHGLGGIWGAIAVGLFSVSQYSWVGMGGLIEGGWQLLAGQLVSVAVTLLYCFVVSFVLMKLLDTVSRKVTGKGAALSESEQMIGADVIEHGESSYVM